MKDAAAQLPAAPDRARLEAAPRRAPYLKSIRMTSFGAFKDKVVGPFSPHLNVVFGRNEAGKTTVSAFVRGVLFGWEEARGTRNTYRPSNAERAGSLIFAEAGGDGSASAPSDQEPASREWELSRIRNSDGLKGDASLVADIDKETYTTMFSLNSDELRTLRGTTNVTAKLLTAGSGTGSSPTEALAEIQRRLAELTSRSSSAPDSLANLAAEIADVRTRLSQAYDEAANVRHLDKEFAELEPERAEMLQRIEAANDRIERLTAQRAAVERIDQQLLELRRHSHHGRQPGAGGIAADKDGARISAECGGFAARKGYRRSRIGENLVRRRVRRKPIPRFHDDQRAVEQTRRRLPSVPGETAAMEPDDNRERSLCMRSRDVQPLKRIVRFCIRPAFCGAVLRGVERFKRIPVHGGKEWGE